MKILKEQRIPWSFVSKTSISRPSGIPIFKKISNVHVKSINTKMEIGLAIFLNYHSMLDFSVF